MGRKAMGSQTVRFTASQRRLILDYLEGGYIRNDVAYAADWKIVTGKLNAQNKHGGYTNDEGIESPDSSCGCSGEVG